MRPFKEVLFDVTELLDIQVAERRTILFLCTLYVFVKAFIFFNTADDIVITTEKIIAKDGQNKSEISPKDAMPLGLAGGIENVQLATVDTISLEIATSVSNTERSNKPLAEFVYINTATKEELLTLPGIGPAYAERILELRSIKGLFSSIDELLLVKGIGPSRLERLKPFVKLSPTDEQ